MPHKVNFSYGNPAIRYQEYLEYDYENTDDKELKLTFAACKGIIEKGGSLYLYGSAGTGKTAMALNLLKYTPIKVKYAYQKPEVQAAFLNADEFWVVLNSSPEDKLRRINDVSTEDIVVLDDLSYFNLTEAKRENLYLLVNKIYARKRQIIITSNFYPNALEEIDPRIYSRLGQIAKFFQLTKIRRPKYGEYEKISGNRS